MNDILARFLVITNSEVDSYWMFCHYMDLKKSDFLENTMMEKIGEFMVERGRGGERERAHRKKIYHTNMQKLINKEYFNVGMT